MTSRAVYLRDDERRFYRVLKMAARQMIGVHVPVLPPLRPLFRVLHALHIFIREARTWLCRFCWYEPLFRSQCESVGERFQMEQLPYVVGHGRIVIGSRVRLSGKPSIAFNNRTWGIEPELQIGDGTFIGHGCAFNIGGSIRVGDNCLIAAGVHFQDQDGHPIDAFRRRAHEPTPPDAIKPIVIGDDVWIGIGAIVLKGVTIGDRSIVGARAVVTKDVPPDVVVAGNPASVIRSLSFAS